MSTLVYGAEENINDLYMDTWITVHSFCSKNKQKCVSISCVINTNKAGVKQFGWSELRWILPWLDL